MRVIPSFVCLVLLSGCAARIPPGLQGSFAPITVADAQADGRTGERVRWGGEIVATTPEAGETCFQVVSKPLDRQMRPIAADETFGRFVACAAGFYDPAIYAPERDLTVAGILEPASSGKVGGADYAFPKVRAQTVWLWPKRMPREVAYYPYGYGWGYPGWGWGVGWGGYWGRGPYFVGRRTGGGKR